MRETVERVDMIAFPHQIVAQGQRVPRDTGCVFPFGSGGRDVRVRLLTDDPEKAEACGAMLKEWGLPYLPEVLRMPRVQATFAMDLLAKPERMVTLPAGDPRRQMFAGHAEVPRWIKFGGDLLMLETLEKADVLAFARWFDVKARRAAHYKQAKPPSLTELADAGEIETIEAG